ncbi:MAG: hypothetical protein P1U56_19295 [Saprospiraceae bacterium]|nr:hypothetical protein [Saprospiraceae bacterium]
MKNLLILIFCTLVLASCKPEPKKPIGKFGDLSALPENSMKRMITQATYIDYIFYDLPFSISQDDQPSIHSNLKLIALEQLGSIQEGCKPIGREFFHINGEIAYEAEIYFQEGCYGYVFFENNKPAYANKISPSGMKFYSNIIQQAAQIQNKALNGG